ncbi:MAG TPA: hypothetical protein VL172_04205 [Kofleriaceae bacterium]|nr:hypothetical protein [Kofleriaceae bacterium]
MRFDDLRPDATWYPLAVLPRGDTDDRLAGGGVSMPPRAGMTMVLTGEADPSAAPLDDLAEFIGDQTAGAGEVQLRVRGNERDLDEVEEVELIDALTGVPLAKAPAAAAKRLVVGQFLDKPIDKQDWPATRLAVGVARGSQKDARPAPGVRVELRPESGEPMVATSNDEGVAVFDNLVAGASYTPAVVQFGTSITGASFKTPEKNGEVLVAFIDWEDPVKTAGFRGLPGGNDHVYVVRAQAAGRVQLSQPFQLTRMRGALLPLELAPPPEFEFHIAGSIDDAQMSFQAQLTMTNGSAAPYTPAGGSAHMPLPRGARHVAVEDQWKDRVKVESGGLTWKGAVPPEGFQFNCSFTLPIEDGSLTLDMDVPQGAFDSSIAFEYRQGMQIATAGKAEGHTTSQQGRRFYVISDINVGSGQSLVLKVTGMPQQPAWRTWVRNAVGLGVLALLALGITGVFIGRRRGVEAGGSERDRLLDQLVDVERRFRDGTLAEAKYKKQRGRLTQRLEVLFGGTPGSAPPPPAED